MYDKTKMMFSDEDFGWVDPDFSISIHAFFTKRKESIGLDILDGMKQLLEKSEKKLGYSINLVFTRDPGGGRRLTKESAMQILKREQDIEKISKVFVCGPPPQNIMFNEI